MTFDERVDALTPLSLTPRQTRFLVTVALHGGFCLRRQYAAFAGLQYGQPVRDFLDNLVSRDLARRFVYRRDRGFLYHLHARPLYEAIGQDDNRNRRLTGPALIARKLMLLDVVITHPHVRWLATEQEKVEAFKKEFNIRATDLPQRVYRPGEPGELPNTTRYFPHKLPIYLAGDPAVPHFVCLGTSLGGQECESFLRDHATLLARLPAWTLVVAAPAANASTAAYHRAFDRFTGSHGAAHAPLQLSDLRWYCATREAIERRDLARLSVAELTRFRELTRIVAGTSIDVTFRAWLQHGDAALESTTDAQPPSRASAGKLELCLLPHRYSQFGDLPGLC
jgi:hypothetical protein